MTNYRIVTGTVEDFLEDYDGPPFHAVLCDPPYGLGNNPDMAQMLMAWLAGRGYDTGSGFMGKDWDAVIGPHVWQGVYEHMRPGATLMAFGGTRTSDLLGVSIRLAGFERRDSIAYMYGTGFPKSYRVERGVRQHLSEDDACQCDASKHSNGNTSREHSAPDRTHTARPSRGGDHSQLSAHHLSRKAQDSQGDCQQDRRSSDERLPSPGDDDRAFPPSQQYVLERNHSGVPDGGQDLELEYIPSPAPRNDRRANTDYSRQSDRAPDVQHQRIRGSNKRADISESYPHTEGNSQGLSYPNYTTGLPRCTTCGKVRWQQWSPYGTALKPSREDVLLFQKATDGTYAENALRHGVAGLNIDGGRIDVKSGDEWDVPQAEGGTGEIYGFKNGVGRTDERSTPHQQGRWPANTILSHSPGCRQVGVRELPGEPKERHNNANNGTVAKGKQYEHVTRGYEGELVASWDCVPECAVRMLAEQSGETSTTGKRTVRSQQNTVGNTKWFVDNHNSKEYPNETGTAARFFYTPKASSFERSAGLPEDLENDHPTIKPLSICTYIATLLLPPPQDKPRRLLIPFSGAGSEAIGAALAGWDEIVCVEMEPHYVEIAEHRMSYWLKMAERADTTDIDPLFEYAKGVEKAKRERREKIETGQMTLF